MYIELKNINKTFGDFKASDNVSFGIEKGRLIGLLGPSGSGKTTILRMLAGLEKQDSGDILIDGKNVNDLPPSERGIGFVFQSYALFPFMTVYDNIAYGLKVQKKDKAFIKARVAELLELVGLPDVGKRYPSQLSGGQRQKHIPLNAEHRIKRRKALYGAVIAAELPKRVNYNDHQHECGGDFIDNGLILRLFCSSFVLCHHSVLSFDSKFPFL